MARRTTWTESLFHDQEDFRYLAPDRPALRCQGRRTDVRFPDGHVEVFYPCNRILPDLCFQGWARKIGGITYLSKLQARCVICRHHIEAARKRAQRWYRRARNAMASHRRREFKAGIHGCKTTKDYERLTGLTVAELALEMEHSAETDGRCEGSCRRRWSEMEGGWLMQMTLDRPDTSRILSRDNHRLECSTCNSEDATTDPRARDVRAAYWRAVEG